MMEIEVCVGPSCGGQCFSQDILNELKKKLIDPNLYFVKSSSCMGNCDYSPNIKVDGKMRSLQHHEVEDFIKECKK